MNRSAEALELCFELGFDLAGVAPLRPPPAARRLRAWLEAGRHADMDWLERNAERIADPRLVLPAGRSILAVGLGHARDRVALEDGTRIARYAAGRDYHNLIGKRLRKLARALTERGLIDGHARSIVDAGPLLERSHAAEAGLGFESKAANLLHRDLGPWFFLGELLLEEELEPTTTPALGSCGTCTACIDACPTAAILEPGVVDARRCISYQTIENRGQVPPELRPQVDAWAFGCDVCSEVCPWGHKAPERGALFGTHRQVEGGGAVEWLRVPEEAFASRFEGSPLRRPGRAGLARNAAIVLGNRPAEQGREALLAALEGDSSAVVRETAGWSLARAHRGDAGVAARLEAAARREPDPDAARDLARWAGGDPAAPSDR